MINHSINYNKKTFLKTIIPAYFFPAIMSFISGYFRDDLSLMRDSYSYIALTSLIAAIVTYLLLWICEVQQTFPSNKIIRTLCVSLIMLSLGISIAILLKLNDQLFNIGLSSFLGAAITTWNQPITKCE